MVTSSSQAIELFLCYAREDERLCQNLEKQLRALKRQGLIDVWYDRQIHPGSDWQNEINNHLNTAQIILLLISPDFMASDYCYKEMVRALERQERGEAHVIPIILRPTHWQGTPFDNLQVLPEGGKPVVSKEWHSSDDAFFNIADGIRQVIIYKFRPQLKKSELPPVARRNRPRLWMVLGIAFLIITVGGFTTWYVSTGLGNQGTHVPGLPGKTPSTIITPTANLNDASDTMKQFCQYLNKRQLRAAYDLTSSNYQRHHPFIGDFSPKFSNASASNGSCQTDNATKSHGIITVHFSFTQQVSGTTSKSTTNYVATLIQSPQDQRWKIDNIVQGKP